MHVKKGLRRVGEIIPDCAMTTPPFELFTRHSFMSLVTCLLMFSQLVTLLIGCESGLM
jgi:hypothetical protein